MVDISYEPFDAATRAARESPAAQEAACLVRSGDLDWRAADALVAPSRALEGNGGSHHEQQ
ncbi:hypothetical protein P5W98_02645 [Paraburkholderia sp. A1BS-2L]|uniref:hypothetical protein n=1 Tax=unclassified Paraburkholderia TaxID=2615204 RepID=UPI003B7A067E